MLSLPGFALPAAPDRRFSALVRVNGEAGDSLYRCIQNVTVDEDIETGSSFSIQLSACREDDGSYPYIGDDNLEFWNRVTVYAAFPTQTEVVIDGYISNVTISTNPDAATATVDILGVDASAEMNLVDKRKVWKGKSYEDIAREVIGQYGLTAKIAEAADSAASANVPPHPVAQRSTDLAFLRELARRKGYEFFVQGANAYFRPPQLTGAPQKLIAVNFGEQTNCTRISIDADGTRPTEAEIAFIDPMTGETPEPVVETESGLPALGARTLSKMRGAAGMPQARVVPRRLGCMTRAQAKDYATGVLRRNAWCVVATGHLDGLRYGRVLRTRKLVTVKGVGASRNGLYYVRKVRHQLTARTYDMDFELVRNALGTRGDEDFQGESPDAGFAVPALGPGADTDTVRVAEGGPRVMPA
jgi:phage protein D